VGGLLSLISSTSQVSSHVATWLSGTCHVAWNCEAAEGRCLMPSPARTPGQPPDIPSQDGDY